MKQELLINLFPVIAIGFPIVVKLIWRTLTSVSQSFYKLKEKCGKCRILFTLYCWGVMVIAIFIGKTLLIVLAGIGLFYVGGAPNFKDSVTDTVHYIGAVIAIILMYASVCYDYHFYGLAILGALISLIVFIYHRKHEEKYKEIYKILKCKYNNPTFYWVELIALVIITITFYIDFYFPKLLV